MLNIFPQSDSLVVTLLLLLLAAKVMGELMEHWGQPAMVGEILAGVLLGPSLLGLVHISPEVKVIADLGVFLLMVVAGIDIQLEDLRNAVRGRNLWIAVMGFIVPCICGLIIGYVFNLKFLITIFLSLCISITALPVSVRILMDLGKLNTDIGRKIISAAIVNDVVSLMVLGVILEVNKNWESLKEMSTSITITFLKIAILTLILAVVYKLFKKARTHIGLVKKQVDKLMSFLRGKESLFAVVIVFVLIFASLTELAGLHFIVGAFFAALLLNKEILGLRNFIKVRNNTNSITMGFLAPVFFATVGVQFSWGSINNFVLLCVVIIASLISKVAGGYVGGRLANMSRPESLTLGVGLNARGIMEIVIASIALNNKFIDLSLFSILVIMGLVTTLMSPYLLKRSFLLTEKN